jgi:hypothetical protein
MADWIYEDRRLTPETQQMLSQLPLTKAFLGPSLDPEIWAANIAPELENIRRQFEANKKNLEDIITIAAFFGLNSGILNRDLPDTVILRSEEILFYVGYEAFSHLKKDDIEGKYTHTIIPLIINKLREIGLINENVSITRASEILNWVLTSWKIGYYFLPSMSNQSPSENKTNNTSPNKPKDPENLDLGPFEDFINNLPDL